MWLSAMCQNNPSIGIWEYCISLRTFFSLVIFFSLTTICIASPALIITTSVAPLVADKNGNGIYSLLLQEAFSRINQEIEIVQLLAERALMNADSGLTDGDFPRISGLEKLYPNLIRVPEKLSDYEFVAFSKHQKKTMYSWDALQPYDVAIVRGWKILEKNIVNYNSLIRTKDQKLLFDLLVNDRVDIVVYSRIAGNAYIRSQGLEGVIVALEPPLAIREMHLYLNKKHEQLIEPLSNALREMRKDGTYTKINNRVMGRHLQ